MKYIQTRITEFIYEETDIFQYSIFMQNFLEKCTTSDMNSNVHILLFKKKK